MSGKENLIFMYKNHEVLSFEADYVAQRIRFLEKKQRFDLVPYGFIKEGDIAAKLSRFLQSRAIPMQRKDHEAILKATKCQNAFELSFKGHGLSLSNHYWVKREGEDLRYEDINFFTNKWDDTFGRAILNEDYDALSTCDLNVPDIVTPGWGVKGWLYEGGPKLYKLGIDIPHPEEAICEVLASRLAKRLLKPEESLTYELKRFNGRYASVSSPLISIDEELVPLSSVLPYDWYLSFNERNVNKKHDDEFFNHIKRCGLPGLYEFFVKVSCFRSLAFVSDLHFDNLSLIRDMNDNSLRPAPLYDLGGAFGSSKSGKELISKANKGTLVLIYFLFAGLDPNWDYSWYESEKLVGFEDEITEYLSKSDFYTPDLIRCVIEVYHQQKKSLDEMKKRGSGH